MKFQSLPSCQTSWGEIQDENDVHHRIGQGLSHTKSHDTPYILQPRALKQNTQCKVAKVMS